MKKNLVKILGFLLISLITVNVYAAKKEKKNGKVKTIIVGTGKAFAPFCYLDDNGNLAGYEKEVLDAVDELLPQYKFKYETFDFANILICRQKKLILVLTNMEKLLSEKKHIFLVLSHIVRLQIKLLS